MLKKILEKVFKKSIVREIKQVKVLGVWYPFIGVSTTGPSGGYKHTYIIERDGEFIDIEPMDIQGKKYGYSLVDSDSLIGIMANVMFDDKNLK